MPPPIKRPLKDPNQFYAYVWTLDREVIWVGFGHNHRGRPIPSNTTGRPLVLANLLRRRWKDIDYKIYPCVSKVCAQRLEVFLTKRLKPKYNTAIGFAGFEGRTHSDDAKDAIRKASTGRTLSDLGRKKASERMTERNRLNPPRKGRTCSEEHRRKVSEARKAYYQRLKENRNAHQD